MLDPLNGLPFQVYYIKIHCIHDLCSISTVPPSLPSINYLKLFGLECIIDMTDALIPS